MKTFRTESGNEWTSRYSEPCEGVPGNVVHVVTTVIKKTGRHAVGVMVQGPGKNWLTSVDGPFMTPTLSDQWRRFRQECDEANRPAR